MLLAISGSPKKKSNTTSVLNHLIHKCSEHQIPHHLIELAELNIKPCLDCGSCRNTLQCPINDDFNKLLQIFQKAKVIVLGSPVYFGSVTAQLKALMDRTVLLRRNTAILANKFGAGIAIGGSRNGGQELTLQTIHNWMFIHGMFVFSDATPTSHFGGALQGRGSEEALKDQIGMETVENLAKNIINIYEKSKSK